MVSESLSEQTQKRATRKLLIAGIVCVFLSIVSAAVVIAVVIQQNEKKRIPNASLDNQYGSTTDNSGYVNSDILISAQILSSKSTVKLLESSSHTLKSTFYTKEQTSSLGPKPTLFNITNLNQIHSSKLPDVNLTYSSSHLLHISTDLPILSIYSEEKYATENDITSVVHSEMETSKAEILITVTEHLSVSTSFLDLKSNVNSYDLILDSISSQSKSYFDTYMTEMISTNTLLTVSDIDIPISDLPVNTNKLFDSYNSIIPSSEDMTSNPASQTLSKTISIDLSQYFSTYGPESTESESFDEKILPSVQSSIWFTAETTKEDSNSITDVAAVIESNLFTPTLNVRSSLTSDYNGWIVSAATFNTNLDIVPTFSNSNFLSSEFHPIRTSQSMHNSIFLLSTYDNYQSSDVLDIFSSTQWNGLSTGIPITAIPSTVFPDCGNNEFRCVSGQCVNQNGRCDRVAQCEDMSDEMNCPSCVGFQCGNGLCMWSWSVQCNEHIECVDLTDEIGCDHGSSYQLCNNGISIPSYKWCDGVDNCFDNTDEINCTCSFNEESCLDGRCIRTEWICDGHTDCIQETDEVNCSKCTRDQYICKDYSCINKTQICDGVSHCPGDEDEMSCFNMNYSNSLIIQYRGDNYTICSTYWNSGISDFVCQFLGYKNSTKTAYYTASVEGFDNIELNHPVSDYKNILQYMNITSSCTSNMTVSIACMPRECGEQSPDTMIPYVSGGDIATLGKWPWTVSLSHLGRPFCSGTLISEEWVVTAGHCVAVPGSHNYTNDPRYMEVLLGSVKRLRNEGISLRADKVIHHPRLKMTGIGPIHYDVALVHLQKPAIFTNYILPICLPKQDFSTLSNCYIAGWGYIGSNQDVTVQDLREAKLRVFTDNECRQNTVPWEEEVNINITYCSGYQFGYISGCQGDSGSPMMCKDNTGRWTLAGVMSSGAALCGTFTNTANRFTKIPAMLDWIYGVIYS